MIAEYLPVMETRYNRPFDEADETFNTAVYKQEVCVALMKWGHFWSFVVISLSMLFKKFERYNLG